MTGRQLLHTLHGRFERLPSCAACKRRFCPSEKAGAVGGESTDFLNAVTDMGCLLEHLQQSLTRAAVPESPKSQGGRIVFGP